MAADKKKSTKPTDTPETITVCRNRKANHLYEISDELDCGIVLCGSEVKSVRAGKISLEEAYATIRRGELWLVGANIGEYAEASDMNHEAKQARKLLLHKREVAKFAIRAEDRGFTLIPLAVFIRRGFVKVTIALAKGRKQYDKRHIIKRENDRKEMRNAMMKRK